MQQRIAAAEAARADALCEGVKLQQLIADLQGELQQVLTLSLSSPPCPPRRGGGHALGAGGADSQFKTDDAEWCEMRRIANRNLAEQVFTLKQENSKFSGDLRQKDELCQQMEVEASAHLAGA
jgi:hypothetical protein